MAAIALRVFAFWGSELYSDEAYYFLWSLRLAPGYFDHPPLVAWLIRASSTLVPGEIGVRLPFLVAGGLAVPFAALLARELSDDPAVPLLAALLAASAPMLSILGGLALPDAPLIAAYTAALWLIARARGPRWILAGLAVGIALLSKHTAALLAPTLVLLVFWDSELRRDLRTAWPWLGGLTAVALFAPNLAWEARHGWASIGFQLRHGFSSGATVRSALEYVVALIGGAGPVALFAGLAQLARPTTSAERRVAAAVLVPLAVTIWSALRGKVEANWPALVYPALAAAGAVGLVRLRQRMTRAFVGAWIAAVALAFVGYGVEQRNPRLLAGTLVLTRFQGWREIADRTREAAKAACERADPAAPCDPADLFLFPSSYQLAGELAFYGGFRRLGPATERRSQLDLWNDLPTVGEPFLYVGGSEGVRTDFRQRFLASGEGAVSRGRIERAGEIAREFCLVTFQQFRGEVGGK